MLLHLGGVVSILQKDVIGIFDYNTKKSAVTKEFLDLAKYEKKITYVAHGQKTKSFVLTGDKIYFSPISSITLQKRFNTSV